jgi:hypothetical protein
MPVAQQRATGARVQLSPESDAIARRTSWGDLDEDALGADLLAEAEAGRFDFVARVLDELGATDRDDVSFGFMSHLPEDGTGPTRRGALAASPPGPQLHDRIFD